LIDSFKQNRVEKLIQIHTAYSTVTAKIKNKTKNRGGEKRGEKHMYMHIHVYRPTMIIRHQKELLTETENFASYSSIDMLFSSVSWLLLR
jgi:hypothetical protein